MNSSANFFFRKLALAAGVWSVVSFATVATGAPAPVDLSALAHAPLYFEAHENEFVARGRDCHLEITPAEVTLILSQTANRVSRASLLRGETTRAETRLVRLQLAGANPQARMSGREQLSGAANYILGNDPAQWRAGLPLFARVQVSEVYPGVDVLYYANQAAQLEYDFVLQPGADAGRIVLRIEGADRARVDASGDLVLKIGANEIRQPRPVIFQEVRGARKEVRGGYRKTGEFSVGFWLGDYDRNLPLVIDPVLAFSTYLGGAKTEHGWAIARDGGGNLYVAGETLSKNLPVSTVAFTNRYSGGTSAFGDAFVASYTPAGVLRYLTYLGGKRNDGALDIAVDGDGNAYIAGFTDSRNFPLRNPVRNDITGRDNNALRLPPVDGFVAKLDSTGSQLLYSTFIGGLGRDQCIAIALDGANNVFVTGLTESTNDFEPVLNGFQTSSAGAADVFVVKIPTDGTLNNYYATLLGGTNVEYGLGIAVDGSGSAWVAGFTTSSNFPVANAPYPQLNSGATNRFLRSDAFLSRLNSAGTDLLFSTYFGGTNSDGALDVTLDSSGNAFVTGYTYSPDFPTTVTPEPQSGATNFSSHAFLTRVNADHSIAFSTHFGGSRFDAGTGVAVDGGGNAYVTGTTTSTNFFAANAFTDLRALGSVQRGRTTNDVFIAVLNAGGSAFDTNKNLLFGGSGNDDAHDIVVDPSGNAAYIVGQTTSLNLPVANANQPVAGNGKKPSRIPDAFVTGFDFTVVPE